jgi:hypothetical protein
MIKPFVFGMEVFHSLSHFNRGPLLTAAEQTALSQGLERFQASHRDLDSQSNSPDILSQLILAFLTPKDLQNQLYKGNAYLRHLNHVKYLELIFYVLCQRVPRGGFPQLLKIANLRILTLGTEKHQLSIKHFIKILRFENT